MKKIRRIFLFNKSEILANGVVLNKDYSTSAALLNDISAQINAGNDDASCRMPLFGFVFKKL